MNAKQPEQWQLWMLARFPRWVVVVCVMLVNMVKDAELDAYEMLLLAVFTSIGLGGIGGVILGTTQVGLLFAGEYGLIGIFLVSSFWGICAIGAVFTQLIYTFWRGMRREWRRGNAGVPMREKKKEQD